MAILFFSRKIAQTKVFVIHKVLLQIFEDREFWRENNIRQIWKKFYQTEASLVSFQTSIRFGEGCRLLTIEQSF